MSRIGRQPVNLPQEVKTEIKDSLIKVKGPRGELTLSLPFKIEVIQEENKLIVKRKNEDKKARCLQGTIRALLFNMVKGVSEGFKKELEIVGVGYKAQMKGNSLILNIGFSHNVEIKIPSHLKVSTPKPTRIVVEGIDKQKVGEFAAQLKRVYPPEPYKGKGIRYLGEEIRRKVGKALAK